MNTKILIVAGCLIAVVAAIIIVLTDSMRREEVVHTVTLTESGFEPQELRIEKGDTVQFTTTRDELFWPASNLHPSHGIYPEFDPKEPVTPGASWNFRFTKTGEWKYHDHLAPRYRGVVVVDESGEVQAAADCAGNSDASCREQEIEAALETRGLDAAFTLVARYSADSAIAAECHGLAHRIGERAYAEFADRGSVKLTAKTYYCGYGFYHGFMETLLQETADPAKAQEFCAYAARELAAETTDAGGACYHGIGHGTVDGGDPRAWGNPHAMIEPGLAMCRKITGERDIRALGDNLYRCVTGAYNALEVLSADPKYKLEKLAGDPLPFCDDAPLSYREGCYTNMLPALIRLRKSDYPAMFREIHETIREDGGGYVIRAQVILSLAHELIRETIAEPGYAERDLAICRALPAPARLPCVEGLSGGHIKYGEPAREYVKGLAFCASPLLESAERRVCYEHILRRLRIWYSAEKSREICAAVPETYRAFCPP